MEDAPEPEGVYDIESTYEAMRMIRILHDATAGTELAGDQEVVLHGDLTPWNTVYQLDSSSGQYRPVAFIDWEEVRPGSRKEDVAYAIRSFLGLGFPDTQQYHDVHPSLIRQCCDIYGLTDRVGLADLFIAQQKKITDDWKQRLDSPRDEQDREIASVAYPHCVGQLEWISAHKDDYQAAIDRDLSL